VDYRFVFSGSITGTPDYFVSTAWGGSGGGGGLASGTPIYIAPQLSINSASPAYTGYSFLARLHGIQFRTLPASGGWKVALYTLAGTETIGSAVVYRTLPLSNTVIDSTAFAFTGTSGVVGPGPTYSDAIPLAVDRTHDYVVVAYVSSAVGDTVANYCVGGAEVSYSGGDLTTYTTGGTLPTLTTNTICDFYGAYVF
jgi:hypothetical protein